MKTSMLMIGMLTLGAVLAAGSTPAHAAGGVAGRWHGVLLRDGVEVPISLELSGMDHGLSGRLQAFDVSAPIRVARANVTSVHFEVAGEGVFDGTVAGDAMAGSVSGAPAAGSFSLTRETDQAFTIYSSGP